MIDHDGPYTVFWLVSEAPGLLEAHDVEEVTALAAIDRALALFLRPGVWASCVRDSRGVYVFWLDIACEHPDGLGGDDDED